MIDKEWRWKILGLDFTPGQGQRKLAYVAIAIILIFSWLLSSFGVFRFSLWGQVEYLGCSNVSTWHLIEVLDPHALRYLLVWTIYFIERSFEIDRGIFYNLLISFLLLCIPLYMYFSLNRMGVGKPRSFLFALLCLAIYVILGQYMNGRIIWAHAGILMAITAPLFYRENFFSAILLFLHMAVALLMASVSSGTLMVLSLSIAGMTCIYLKRIYDKKRILYSRIVPLLAVFLIFSPWVVAGIFKNINFYGDGINGVVNMADHGTLSIVKKILIGQFQVAPAVDQVAPVMDQVAPVMDQVAPVMDQVAPAVDQVAPAVDQVAPAVDQDGDGAAILEKYKRAIFFLSILPMLVLALLILYARKHHLELNLSVGWIALMFVILVGQFGYSTLTLAIPLVLLLIAIDPFRRSSSHN